MESASFMKAIDKIDDCLKNEDLNEEYRVYLDSLLKIFRAMEGVNYEVSQIFESKEH